YVSPIRETIRLRHIADADLAALPLPSQSVDGVMASWVLEHVERPERVFAEFARVLRPGGYFLFITPNAANYLIWARRLMPNRVGRRVVDQIYRRGENFIFPTRYRANTRRAIEQSLLPSAFQRGAFHYISDRPIRPSTTHYSAPPSPSTRSCRRCGKPARCIWSGCIVNRDHDANADHRSPISRGQSGQAVARALACGLHGDRLPRRRRAAVRVRVPPAFQARPCGGHPHSCHRR
ncbi:MAG: class I SAM-dependent methyltransferase, partial [Blastochloris sp.]|nr:class I SAM-dependent methyltransferase [Blastochloris sp.]